MEVEIGRGKKARRAYGFDDVAIVPSRRTRDPDDVDITWTLGPVPVRAPAPRLGDGRRRVPGHGRHHRQARRPRGPEPRGHLDPLRGRRRAARADRGAGPRRGDAGDAGDLPGAGQGRADRAADRGDQGPWRRRRRVADAAAGGALVRDRARRRARHPRHPGHRDLGRARLQPGARAEPQGVRARGAGAGRARRLRELLDGPAPDAHRRVGRAGRGRPGRGVHHARRARHRRPAGDRDRRRGRGPLPAHARDRRVLPRDRRRRHAQRRRRGEGVRVRRRRGDGRLAAGARLRGARPRVPLGHGDVPPVAPARRARAHDPERHARGDHHRPRARERRHVQPDGRAADLDGDVRLPGHRGVQPRGADGRAVAADRGQAAPARAAHRHGRPRWSGGACRD